MSEKDIIKSLISKEQNGIDMLIDSYGKLIYGVLSDITSKKNTNNDVEEIFYQVILKLWEVIDLYDEQRGNFRNFILSISKYTAIDYMRKNEKTREIYIDDSLYRQLKEDTEECNELIKKESFEELLNGLNDMDREIFIRRYYLENDISEIAQYLGKKEDYIYTRLSRGRKQLKEIIGGVEYER